MTKTGERNSSLIKEINPTRKNVRNFGILFAAISAGVGAWMLFRGKPDWAYVAGLAAVFLAGAFAGYRILRPLYIGWMSFAYVLAWLNTRIILSVFYYLVFTPIGLVLRLTGKDLLDTKIEKERQSYWIKRRPEDSDPKRAEHPF